MQGTYVDRLANGNHPITGGIRSPTVESRVFEGDQDRRQGGVGVPLPARLRRVPLHAHNASLGPRHQQLILDQGCYRLKVTRTTGRSPTDAEAGGGI